MVPSGSAHTEQEIRQQPDLWREVGSMIEQRRAEIDAFCAPLLARPELRVVLTGAGTSAFVGDVAGPALSRRLGRRVEAVSTTDIVGDPLGCFPDRRPVLLVSIARSGNSPESVAATRLADQFSDEAHHLIVTCDATGSLATSRAEDDRTLVISMPERANDRGFAMTSSFTSMLLTLLLALTGDDRARTEALADAAEALMATTSGQIESLVAAGYDRVIYLGSGAMSGLAHESSLKLLELTAGMIDAYYETPLGFRHGPKALVDERTLVVVYVSNDPYTRFYDLDLARELLQDGVGGLLVIAAGPVPGFEAHTWGVGSVEGIEDAYIALPFVVFAQEFAVACSLRLQLTPDNPFPGGTVNRVVQGVHIREYN
jgi:tagatose-6-phosphate ketose/aldose isomerase